jgi:hypothetical protein
MMKPHISGTNSGRKEGIRGDAGIMRIEVRRQGIHTAPRARMPSPEDLLCES